MSFCVFFRRLCISVILGLLVSFSTFAQQVNTKTVAEDLVLVSYSSLKLPVDLGLVVFDSWELTDSALEYVYLCKTEEMYESSLLGYENLKTSTGLTLKEMANSSNMFSLLVIIDSGRDMKYHYCSPSGKKFTLHFSNSELLGYLGISKVTHELRERAVKTLIGVLSTSELPIRLDEINDKSVCYRQYLDMPIEDGFKFNLHKECLNDLLSGNKRSFYPLCSLYLGKGYVHTVVSTVNNKILNSEATYELLTEIYAYVKEEQQKIKSQQELEEEVPVPFQLVKEKPSFQGGDANAFSRWVNMRLVYPELAKDNGVQGRVSVQFTIEKDGTVTNVKVLRGVDPSLDAEAVRVVSSSPKWTPGMMEGKVVRVTYTYPVVFSLR